MNETLLQQRHRLLEIELRQAAPRNGEFRVVLVELPKGLLDAKKRSSPGEPVATVAVYRTADERVIFTATLDDGFQVIYREEFGEEFDGGNAIVELHGVHTIEVFKAAHRIIPLMFRQS